MSTVSSNEVLSMDMHVTAPALSPRASTRRLLDLEADVFSYLCAFIPIDDLLLRLSAACRTLRQRTWDQQELWQQLWMRYLVHFYDSLIPALSRPLNCTAERQAVVTFLPGTRAPADHRTLFSSSARDVAWRLYHYHASKEARPRVELLDRLSLLRRAMDQPEAAQVPGAAPLATLLPTPYAEEIYAYTLVFAQACATHLVVGNLSYMAASPSPSSPPSPSRGAMSASTPSSPRVSSAIRSPTKRSEALVRRRARQTDLLRRALHFLLSSSGTRPALEDRLWTSTYQASEEYQQEMTRAARHTHDKGKRQRAVHAVEESANSPRPQAVDQLRPLSWLDNRDTSVKVLLFDDDTRSVGDANSVQAERIKLLAAIAHHWRLAYAHQFYLTSTDGRDYGGGGRRPTSPPPSSRGTTGNPSMRGEVGAGAQGQQTTGRAAWEDVYRRFRDEGGSSAAAAAVGTGSALIPSSGNPLFDLHLLTFPRRFQLYASMLASTAEVPDGMGVFFATCVSESFLRWWCWRGHAAKVPPPPPLWTARVCSVHKPQYGTTAGDGAFGHAAPMEAEESIAYSSSYSDVTTSEDGNSNLSIEFIEDAEVEPVGNPQGSTRGEESTETAEHSPALSPSRPPAPRVALLFPLPHMLSYWFMMHHVTFYSYQVYRRVWGEQETTMAVCSRILGPTGHSIECRLFYTLRYTSFPRMHTKMVFTPGVLPGLTMQEKSSARSPYRSPSTSEEEEAAASSSSSSSPTGAAPQLIPQLQRDSDFSAEVRTSRTRRLPVEQSPVDSRQVYSLFWTGFGRVEVESAPALSSSNLVRLRVALGLPGDFPMGLLWNVLMFASGVGPVILKDHRDTLQSTYGKTFTDVLEETFGEVSCYGYGAFPPSAAEVSADAIANPLDAEAVNIEEQQQFDRLLNSMTMLRRLAQARQEDTVPMDSLNASYSTAEADLPGEGEAQQSSASSPLTSSSDANGSWGRDSSFSSDSERTGPENQRSPYSDDL